MLPHSGHDFTLLLSRWEAVVERGGVELRILGEAGGYPFVVIENEMSAARDPGGIYLSAGVHGDECAPVWALLQWMESDPEILRRLPVVVFPCFNPSGFVENIRQDHSGIDLNRCFENINHPVIGSWQNYMKGRQFDLALNLHEDYDAGGIYLYELARGNSMGNQLLAGCEKIIPRETASNVDGSDFMNGLLTRSSDLERVVEEELGGGYPEAILLFLRYSENSYTFETPSEFDLIRRIEAHQAFLEAATSLLVEGA